MMRGILTVVTGISVILFPWPLSATFALLASLYEPLVPFAAGLLADTLYYVPHNGAYPLFSIGGLLVSVVAYGVHQRLRTGTIGR